MNELSAFEIVSIWERNRGRTLGERAVELLAAGGHRQPPEQVTVGERDALLTELRERTFGASFEAVVDCPGCAEALELELSTADLPVGKPPPAEGHLELELSGARVRFRLPTAADLATLAGSDAGEGEKALLERCLIEPSGEISAELGDAVAAQMAVEDPGAWVELALTCPACEREWSAPFDVVAFLWAEIEASARRLLHDVHLLAAAYGWREPEILALSPARRDTYLELVAG